jgi:hypothetical protein
MDLFYKIWVESEQERNEYSRVDVHWSDVPGRDAAWKESMIRNTSAEQFRQEFECEFLGSSNTLIHPSVLSRLVFFKPVSEKYGVKIYEEPIKGHQYVLAVDVSEGLGLDSSAFVMVDVSQVPYQVVATYKNNTMSELLYPTLLDNIGRYYNDAAILVEVNTGSQVVNILHQDLEYENVVMTRTSGRKGTVLGAGGTQNRLGLKTTKSTKRIGCSNIKSLIENTQIILNDYDVINQLSTYVVDGTSYNAEEGHHDDLVMCLVLFAWMVSQEYFKEISDTDVRKKILEDNERQIEEEMTPFGWSDDGMPEEVVQTVSDYEFEKLLLN